MNIADWLLELGLPQYVAAFRDNDIDLRVLPRLTADDLREIGVVSVGHRRLILQAIVGLLANSPDLEVAAQASPQLGARPPAERRRLTVMFVDLVGSTKLTQRYDPEDVRDLLGRFQDAVASEIGRVGGHLAKFMGDGVLAYFGWPNAHEDEAERSVRAALAIISAVGGLTTLGGEALASRIGIATGSVVVGDLIGKDEAREESVVGETPNLAARLQALAPPGGIMLANSTRLLLGDIFDLAPIHDVEIKGFNGKLTVWKVIGEAAHRGRFEARHSGALAPMIGRDQELALLQHRWAAAQGGEGQAVLLVGEAGIGKSRLVRGLGDAVARALHTEVRWQGSPFYSETPLWPVIRNLVENPEGTVLATLERRLAESGVDLATAVPLLAAQINLDPGARYRPPELVPEAQRPKLMLTLLDHLIGLAGRRPLLLVLEDAHWADATTLDLTRLLLDRISAVPVFLVITSRPEGVPPLSAHAHLTTLTLSRLGRAAITAIVGHLVPDRNASAPLLNTIIRRTDGIPLFVEELTKSLVEQGKTGDSSLADPDVPASLHDTLMARLDRLGDSKEVAQLAACIGREVDFDLLAAVADRSEIELRRNLDELCVIELLFRRGTPPDDTYTFKHALVRDAAYESLLKSRRRAIHARLLEAIEHRAGSPAAEQAAYHAAGAKLWAKAMNYYGAAGKVAFDRANNAEGIALVAKALDAGAHLSGDPAIEAAMIDLLRARGWAYLTAGETQRMLEELDDTEQRADRFGLAKLTCQLRTQRTHVESIFGNSAKSAIDNGRSATRLATSLDDPELLSAARFVLGHAFWIAGDYRAGVAELSVDADTYRHGLRIAGVGSSGLLAVDGLAVLGDCLGQLGRREEARTCGEEARTIATEAGSTWDMNVANYHRARALLAGGDALSALPLIEWNTEFAQRRGLRMALPLQLTVLGNASLLLGRPDEAIETLDRAVTSSTELRLQYACGHALVLRGEAFLLAGRKDAAEAVSQALEFARSHFYRAFEATALRLLAAAAPATHDAGRLLAEARAIAEELGLDPELDAIGRLGSQKE